MKNVVWDKFFIAHIIFWLGIYSYAYSLENCQLPPPSLICYLLSTWQLTILYPYLCFKGVESSFSWGFRRLCIGLGYSWLRSEALWLGDHQFVFCYVTKITFDCIESFSHSRIFSFNKFYWTTCHVNTKILVSLTKPCKWEFWG